MTFANLSMIYKSYVRPSFRVSDFQSETQCSFMMQRVMYSMYLLVYLQRELKKIKREVVILLFIYRW
jgi:hypothetical protein